MLNRKKSYGDIMKVAHIAPETVYEIKNKLTGESPNPPIFTQAYQLFFSGKTSYEVAVELQITEKEARKYEFEYRRLNRADKLSHLCQAGDTLAITKLEILAVALDKNGITPNQYENYFLRIDRIEKLASDEKSMKGSVLKLTQQQKRLEEQNGSLRLDNAMVKGRMSS